MRQTSGPFIRVVIPTFNRASLVVGAIESVLSQTFLNFEIIVSNDGSTDETQKVVEEIAVIEPRITLITNPNGGLPVSRNRALAVPGEYDFVAFLDDDDRWVPTHLEESLDLFQTDAKLDVVFARVQSNDLTGTWTDAQHKIRESRMHKAKSLATESLGMGQYLLSPAAMWQGVARNEMGIHPSTVVVRRNSVHRTLWFDPSLAFFEDMEFFIYLIQKGCHFGFIDKAHTNVYYQGDNLSGGQLPLTNPKLARQFEIVVKFRQRIFDQCENSQDRKIARKILSKISYLLGQCYASQGQKGKARQSYWRGMKTMPTWRVCKGYLLSLLPLRVWNGLRELRS